MIEEAASSYLPLLFDTALRVSVLFFIALGFVYISGRMLEIVTQNRWRNLIAVMTIFPAAYWSILIYDTDTLIHPHEIYWRTITYGAMACVLYVVVGWRFYDRVDNLLDKKVAEDTPSSGKPARSKKG